MGGGAHAHRQQYVAPQVLTVVTNAGSDQAGCCSRWLCVDDEVSNMVTQPGP